LLRVINPSGLPVKSFRMDASGIHVEIATDSNVPERTTHAPPANGVTTSAAEPEAFDVPHPAPGNWDPPSED